MGVTSVFAIELERGNGIYYAGEVVKGKVKTLLHIFSSSRFNRDLGQLDHGIALNADSAGRILKHLFIILIY